MQYLNVSFTHKNTDIAVRERLSFSDESKKKEILRLVSSNINVAECLVLSTCNRVEIFAFVSEIELSKSYILKAISVLSGVALNELEARADLYYGSGAIHHLFTVASSLDSLVVGETQIVGQLKDALSFANKQGSCGVNLNRAVKYAFKCAAKVRTNTQISKNPVSVSSVAVNKAKEIFGSLDGKKTLVVGAGDMSELACKHLLANGAKVVVVNRSLNRALSLKEKLQNNIEIEEFSHLKELVNSHELIFSATGSLEPIITNRLIEERDFDRYFFDIAVPRDIEISESVKIKVYSVDDLQEIVKINMALREEQAQIAYAIVGRDTNEFFKKLKILAATPIIKSLRKRARDFADRELEKAIKRGYLKRSDLDESRKLIHQVFKSFLHTPTVNLKELSFEDDGDNIIRAIEQVFDIEVDDEDERYNFDIENLENIDEI